MPSGSSVHVFCATAYCAMDLMFIVDSSGSVRDNQVPNQPDNWSSIIKFVSSVIQAGTRVGYYYDHVSVITYSNVYQVRYCTAWMGVAPSAWVIGVSFILSFFNILIGPELMRESNTKLSLSLSFSLSISLSIDHTK